MPIQEGAREQRMRSLSLDLSTTRERSVFLSGWSAVVGIALLGVLMSSLLAACQRIETVNRQLAAPDSLAALDAAPFLKAHMQNGQVYVLSDWTVEDDENRVEGTGQLLDVHRNEIDEGTFAIPLDSVALFETNTLETSGPTVAMSIITGVSAALTVYCLTNWKACFGSCPTFYAPDGDSLSLQAEGFSSSIAPSLEARDIDALYRVRPRGGTFQLVMKNEALETHVVRSAELLLAPRPKRGRVVARPDGTLWQVTHVQAPRSCTAPEGTCRSAVTRFDGEERFSMADSVDLAARETIELAFETPSPDSAGLLLGTRQTLLTTFLLYQTLSYMGRQAGSWLATLERSGETLPKRPLARTLGGIEVLVPDSTGGWSVADAVHEHGPLASDVHLIPLPSGITRIRLRMAKGTWRIDYAALARLGAQVEPVRLPPAAVHHDGQVDATAREQLREGGEALTMLPGDTYTLHYELPDTARSYEVLLESSGYYLEWMRREWLREENQQLARQMIFEPRKALKRLAPVYKQVEPEMEKAFWRSRYHAR